MRPPDTSAVNGLSAVEGSGNTVWSYWWTICCHFRLFMKNFQQRRRTAGAKQPPLKWVKEQQSVHIVTVKEQLSSWGSWTLLKSLVSLVCGRLKWSSALLTTMFPSPLSERSVGTMNHPESVINKWAGCRCQTLPHCGRKCIRQLHQGCEWHLLNAHSKSTVKPVCTRNYRATWYYICPLAGQGGGGFLEVKTGCVLRKKEKGMSGLFLSVCASQVLQGSLVMHSPKLLHWRQLRQDVQYRAV